MRFLSCSLVFLAAAAPLAPTRENCTAAVHRARAAVTVLPPGSMARRFADSDLVQAAAEAGNGEFDDCLEYAALALDEVKHPQHSLVPPHKP